MPRSTAREGCGLRSGRRLKRGLTGESGDPGVDLSGPSRPWPVNAIPMPSANKY
jgi:hypothetical protein